MLLVLGFSNTNAQDENNPWAISVAVNAVDLYPVGEDAPLGGTFDEYFNVTEITTTFYLHYLHLQYHGILVMDLPLE